MRSLKDEQEIDLTDASSEFTSALPAPGLLSPHRQFDPAHPELIEEPDIAPDLLRGELKTLENCNRLLGGHALVVRYVARMVQKQRLSSLHILDLGTGMGDIPRAIILWARQQNFPITITAVDNHAGVLAVARQAAAGFPEITFAQHDLRRLPYAPGSFDLILCSLVLHHCREEEAVQLLRSMQTLARRGFLVNDLRRNWIALWVTEVLTRTLFRSPIFRHDARQSCRAAFSIKELRGLATRAELENFKVSRQHWFFRMLLEGKIPPPVRNRFDAAGEAGVP